MMRGLNKKDVKEAALTAAALFFVVYIYAILVLAYFHK